MNHVHVALLYDVGMESRSIHRHPEGHTVPAFVALVTGTETVEHNTLNRTWITASGKAAIARPRLLWAAGRRKHGVIQPWPDDEITNGLAIAIAGSNRQ